MYPRYSQPGFSRLVQRMETDGLVERRPDPADRRASIVVLTRAGRTQFRNANTVYVDALRGSFGRHLADDEHRRLTRMLTSVTTRRRNDGDGTTGHRKTGH
jgi:DNA-binding MarR family transcriptional regulator